MPSILHRFAAGLGLVLALANASRASADSLLADQKEDIAAASAYVLGSRAFSSQDRAAALARIDEDLKSSTPWTPAGFLVELMHITAQAHNGHDSLHTHGGWSPPRRLPLRLSWLADGLVVTRASPALASLAGHRVVAIDGHDLGEVMQALRQVDGGADEYIRWNDVWMLVHPDMLHALGLARAPDRVTLTLEDGHGTWTREVTAVPSDLVPHDIGRLGPWSHQLSAGEREAGWVAAVFAAEDPLWLQERDRMFRLVELPELDALYLQFRGNLDGPGGDRLTAFVERVQQALQTTGRHHLVLDQRLNTGGNADLTEDLMRQIGHWQRGRLYVLVGPQTFSAGIVSAALAVHESGGHAVVVGDTVGDRLRWWSEPAPPVCLPHARYCLHGSTGLWDLQHGCGGEAHCYGDRFHAEVPGLKPQVPAPLTAVDLMRGRDAAMDAVRRDLLTP